MQKRARTPLNRRANFLSAIGAGILLHDPARRVGGKTDPNQAGNQCHERGVRYNAFHRHS